MWHSSPSREVLADVLGPLIRLGEQHAVRVVAVDLGADLFHDGVRLGQVLVVRALPLAEIGDRVEPQAVDSHVEPVPHRADHGFDDLGIVVVEVGLVREEAVPVVLTRDGIPGPVRLLGVREDDARAEVLLIGVAPDVEAALRRAARRAARGLEPGVLVRCVVHDELGDDLETAPVSLSHEGPEVALRSVDGIDAAVTGDVVAVVAHRRRIERQQPNGVHAESRDVVELLCQSPEVADAVVVRVEERAHVQLIDDRILVPERVAVRGERVVRHRCLVERLHEVIEVALGRDAATEPENVRRRTVRIERHEVAAAAP